jgi:hypothetical protein
MGRLRLAPIPIGVVLLWSICTYLSVFLAVVRIVDITNIDGGQPAGPLAFFSANKIINHRLNVIFQPPMRLLSYEGWIVYGPDVVPGFENKVVAVKGYARIGWEYLLHNDGHPLKCIAVSLLLLETASTLALVWILLHKYKATK